MNLAEATTMSQLSVPTPVKTVKDTLSSTQVAFRILARCEAGGYPYKHFPVNRHGAKAWAKKFLTSKEFQLMRINLNAAASPHQPRDPKRVKFYKNILASKMGKPPDFDPIVVDVNRRREGRTHLGYIPDVIVTDGKHRKASMLAAGINHYWAWVGKKAIKKMKPKDIKASAEFDIVPVKCDGSKIQSQYEMMAATVPAVSMPARQDTGSGGSRPKDHMHSKNGKKVNAQDCQACGAVSTGSLEPGAASDDKIPPDSSDVGSSVNASDRRKWNPDKPNLYPSGLKPGNANQFGLNKAAAYGNEIGPRVVNKGASKSELARGMEVKAGKKVGKIWTKKKKKMKADTGLANTLAAKGGK